MAAKVICSWCNRMKSDGDLPASHGICKECEELFFPERTERQRPECVAESGQAFADDFERIHGHTGQGARRLD